MHANLADAIKQCAMHIADTIAIGIDKGYDTAVYKCLFPNVHVSSLPGIAHKTFETRPTPAISSFWWDTLRSIINYWIFLTKAHYSSGP